MLDRDNSELSQNDKLRDDERGEAIEKSKTPKRHSKYVVVRRHYKRAIDSCLK